MSYDGAQAQSTIQLEFSPGVMSLKDVRDLTEFVRTQIAPKFFTQLADAKQAKEFAVTF